MKMYHLQKVYYISILGIVEFERTFDRECSGKFDVNIARTSAASRFILQNPSCEIIRVDWSNSTIP